jgi:RNase H-fold protein (predicted Holliday junction resolvase)
MAYILAIDPGREKNGVAVVSYDKEAICQAVVASGRLTGHIEEMLARYNIKVLVVGNRTGGKALINKLKEAGILERVEDIISVDEDYSTEEGRRRYWQDHPPQGFRRLLPRTLQTPPRPIDDYVAIILAERYIEKMHI